MIWLLVAVISGLTVYATLFWWKIKKFNDYLKHVPGPKPLPIVGNALDLIRTDLIIPALTKYRDEHGGGLTKVFIGPDRAVLLAFDYNFLEHILTSIKTIDKSEDYTRFYRWLGLGLLTSTGAKWQTRRKLITPSFHFQILETFIDVFGTNSTIMVERLKREVGKKSVDVYPYVTLCALDVICESAMGISVNAQKNEKSEYVTSVKDMGRIFMERTVHPFKQYDFFYYLTRDYRKELAYLKILHKTTDDVISQRREELLKNNNVKESSENDVGSKKRKAFLDMLLQATTPDGQGLSNLDIREEVDTFMFEGHDTTASGITFGLYLLSKNPQVQTKAFEEIRSILGDDKTKEPTYRDLQDMKYLELIVQEVLRLYPSVPFFGRELSEDLEFEGHTYPEGLTILLPAFHMHRNSKYFQDPDTFNPDRFTMDNKAGRKPFSYFPFSAGPRNCIGQKFAMMELKSTLSKVLRHYELLEVPGFEPLLSAETILKSLNGVHVRIKERVY